MKLLALGLTAALAISATLAADAPGPVAGPLIKTTVTSAGQPISLPQGPVEVSAVVAEVAAGGATPVHKHLFPRYGYVLQGRLEIDYLETGEKKVLEAGEFFIDPVGTWHRGRAIGGPVKMLIIDQTPPGASNMVLKDGAGASP